MTVTTAQQLTVPSPRGRCPLDVPPAYQQAAQETPVVRIGLPFGEDCWLITRYEDVRAVLTDSRFSADATRPGFPLISEELRAMAAATRSTDAFVNEQEHLRRRRMLTTEFKAKRVEALRPEIQQMVDDTLDQMIAGGSPADLMADFAVPVGSGVIALLLGVPTMDTKYFQERSHVLLDEAAKSEEKMAAQRDLMEYVVGLTVDKQQNPDEGFLSRLVERGELTGEEVAGSGLLLLLAGHETTAAMIALSIIALHRNPEQQVLLRQDPSLVKGAVEEMLRYATLVQNGLGRVAVEDAVIGGQLIRAGEGVLCMLSTANRDEEVFPGGGHLDVTRPARGHMSFGYGLHQCVGQSLARAELQIALGTLLRRLPELRLDVPVEELGFRYRAGLYAVDALPVAW
ncbi:cytochrome P450 [Streptomyces sp. CG 926]|uniref:cytochrome P450 n=1 Tax=Streptomyces sp. CG 926 TaxID=1882405 RepID=UPI000D7A5447|nr:cytochrome P450 [Streptomyces sp. CG 926]PWK63502.1 cytochrome P450 [Streptomyces sp. CG 926]